MLYFCKESWLGPIKHRTLSQKWHPIASVHMVESHLGSGTTPLCPLPDGCVALKKNHGVSESLHRQITSSGHVRSIDQVAHIGIVVGWWQWRAGSVHVWLHCLRVIHGIACSIHRCAIWQVAHGIAEESTGQWRTRSVWIWSNGLRMIDAITSLVHWRAIRQVA